MTPSRSWSAPPALVSLRRRQVSSFFLAGLVGAVVSGAAGVVLAYRLSLSAWIVIVLWALSLTTLLALAKLTQVVTGEPTLVYYRHEIAIVGVSALTLVGEKRVRRLPVLNEHGKLLGIISISDVTRWARSLANPNVEAALTDTLAAISALSPQKLHAAAE